METLNVFVESIAESFRNFAPFSDPTLLVAFEANPEETQRILQKACKKVMSAPIRREEYEWFRRFVFQSSIWMQRARDGSFLFEQMMQITASMSEKVDNSMDSIFA